MSRLRCHAFSESARRRLLLPVALTWAVSGAAGASDVPELELKVPTEVQAMLMAHVKAGTVESPMASLTLTSAIEHKANFGNSVRHRTGQQFAYEANGLIATTVLGSLAGNSETVNSSLKMLTACGLIPVLAESSSVSSRESTMVFSTGAAMLPFGYSSTAQNWTHARLAQLEADSDPCTPQPASSFSYTTDTEVQRKFKGAILASNRHLGLKESTRCTTAAQPLPASSLFDGLRGDYLPVSCRTEGGPRGPVERRLAFLLASGLYVQLEESQDWQSSKTTVEAVSYGNPGPAAAAQAAGDAASSPPR